MWFLTSLPCFEILDFDELMSGESFELAGMGTLSLESLRHGTAKVVSHSVSPPLRPVLWSAIKLSLVID